MGVYKFANNVISRQWVTYTGVDQTERRKEITHKMERERGLWLPQWYDAFQWGWEMVFICCNVVLIRGPTHAWTSSTSWCNLLDLKVACI